MQKYSVAQLDVSRQKTLLPRIRLLRTVLENGFRESCEIFRNNDDPGTVDRSWNSIFYGYRRRIAEFCARAGSLTLIVKRARRTRGAETPLETSGAKLAIRNMASTAWDVTHGQPAPTRCRCRSMNTATNWPSRAVTSLANDEAKWPRKAIILDGSVEECYVTRSTILPTFSRQHWVCRA